MKIANFDIIKLPEVDSTNNYASLILRKEKIINLTAIMTDFQTSGKGQIGNFWISDRGKNILLSIICFPLQLSSEKYFFVSMATSLAIIDCLNDFQIKSKIKWPNDIHIGNKKVGGILIENTIQNNILSSSVVGIGLNINQTIFPGDLSNVTSLKIEKKCSFNIQSVIVSLLDRFRYWYEILNEKDKYDIKQKYLESLFLYNEQAGFRVKNKIINARIIDVKDSGQLVLLDKENRMLTFEFKEIVFPGQS